LVRHRTRNAAGASLWGFESLRLRLRCNDKSPGSSREEPGLFRVPRFRPGNGRASRRDAETQRRGDAETRRRRDAETRREKKLSASFSAAFPRLCLDPGFYGPDLSQREQR
jgi:hypothetical protein